MKGRSTFHVLPSIHCLYFINTRINLRANARKKLHSSGNELFDERVN